jgi:hypothetical protein
MLRVGLQAVNEQFGDACPAKSFGGRKVSDRRPVFGDTIEDVSSKGIVRSDCDKNLLSLSVFHERSSRQRPEMRLGRRVKNENLRQNWGIGANCFNVERWRFAIGSRGFWHFFAHF